MYRIYSFLLKYVEKLIQQIKEFVFYIMFRIYNETLLFQSLCHNHYEYNRYCNDCNPANNSIYTYHNSIVDEKIQEGSTD